MPSIVFRNGLERDLPFLRVSEPGFTTDTSKMFIGSSEGNVELGKQEDINILFDEVDKLKRRQLDVLQEQIDSLNNLLVLLDSRVIFLEGEVSRLVEKGDSGEMLPIARESFSGSSTITKTFEEKAYGFVLSNDGEGDITVNINDYLFTVKAGEVFDENFDEFTTVDIISNGVPYRAYSKGLLGNVPGTTDDITSPYAVTNLGVGKVTPTSIELFWTPSISGDVVKYEVAYSNDGFRYIVATNSIDSNLTNYTVNNLSPDTLYTIRVVALDGAKNRSSEGLVSTTTMPPDTIAPNDVSNLQASNITEKSLVLTWNASSSGDVTGYEILKNGVYLGSSTSTSYTVSNLSTLTDYQFTVKAKDGSGNVSAGVIVFVSTIGDTFAPNVTITPEPGTYTSAQSIRLTADEPATIYYTTDGSVPTTASSVYNGPFTISDNKTIKFMAKDTAGNQSGVQTVSYSIDITPPNEVTNLAASNITETSLTLGWTASTSSDIANYDVYKGATLLGNVTTTSYEVTGLIQNTPYTFKVVSIDALGNKSAGVTVNVTTTADTTAPNDVTNLQATSITTTGLTLTWSASTSSDIDSYDVYKGATLMGNVKTTSYPVTGLSASTSYTFTVKAKDKSSNISAGVNLTTTTAEPQLEVVASDSFTRADTTSGTIGTADVGGGWSEQTGYKITGNQLQYISGLSYPKLNSFTANNFVVQVDIQIPNHLSSGTICGLAVRCASADAHAAIQWGFQSGFTKLGFENTLAGVSGAPTSADILVTPGNWYTLKMEVTGGVYKCYCNGQLVHTYTDAGLTGSVSNTYHGINIYSAGGSIYLDNFKVSKLS